MVSWGCEGLGVSTVVGVKDWLQKYLGSGTGPSVI